MEELSDIRLNAYFHVKYKSWVIVDEWLLFKLINLSSSQFLVVLFMIINCVLTNSWMNVLQHEMKLSILGYILQFKRRREKKRRKWKLNIFLSDRMTCCLSGEKLCLTHWHRLIAVSNLSKTQKKTFQNDLFNTFNDLY